MEIGEICLTGGCSSSLIAIAIAIGIGYRYRSSPRFCGSA
ncbi:MAG: hypothetical protein GQF41_2871 [Candidatus Rifleibacterium amylolyticum]|nr:MAG: hypothetical protein GQF41_2871 [Candidatus Rifleibacterium amylolyticum]